MKTLRIAGMCALASLACATALAQPGPGRRGGPARQPQMGAPNRGPQMGAPMGGQPQMGAPNRGPQMGGQMGGQPQMGAPNRGPQMGAPNSSQKLTPAQREALVAALGACRDGCLKTNQGNGEARLACFDQCLAKYRVMSPYAAFQGCNQKTDVAERRSCKAAILASATPGGATAAAPAASAPAATAAPAAAPATEAPAAAAPAESAETPPTE